MHDCFGKLIKPFDRVRAATKEEFQAQGHTDLHNLASLTPSEQYVLPGTYQSDTCNAYVTPEVSALPYQPQSGGPVEIKFTSGNRWPMLCTSRALVVL